MSFASFRFEKQWVGVKHWGSIKQVKDKKGHKDIRNLKPIDGENVVAESIVLLNEIAVD